MMVGVALLWIILLLWFRQLKRPTIEAIGLRIFIGHKKREIKHMNLNIGQKIGPISVKGIPEGAPISDIELSVSDASLGSIAQGIDGKSYFTALASGTCQVIANAKSASGAALSKSSEDIVIAAEVIEATDLAIDLGSIQA